MQNKLFGIPSNNMQFKLPNVDAFTFNTLRGISVKFALPEFKIQLFLMSLKTCDAGLFSLFSEHLNSLLPNRTAPYSCQRRNSVSDCKEEPDHYYKKVSD